MPVVRPTTPAPITTTSGSCRVTRSRYPAVLELFEQDRQIGPDLSPDARRSASRVGDPGEPGHRARRHGHARPPAVPGRPATGAPSSVEGHEAKALYQQVHIRRWISVQRTAGRRVAVLG